MVSELNGITQTLVDDVDNLGGRDWLFDRFGEPHAVPVTIDLGTFNSAYVLANDTANEGVIPSGLWLKVDAAGNATLASASDTGINAVLADPIRVKFTKTGLKGKVVVSAIWSAVVNRKRIANNTSSQKFATTSLFEYDGKSVPTVVKSAA